MIPVKNKHNKIEMFLVAHNFFRKKLSRAIKEISYYATQKGDDFEVKALIKDIYYKKYRAKIEPAYREFLAISDKNNQILAALGLHEATNSQLFLEQYLDEPIEKVIAKAKNCEISRHEIIEIGSLASGKKGMAQFLYIALAAILKQKGYKYAVITATTYLQNHFKKAGLRTQIIAEARKSRLSNQNVEWGGYYETEPKVMILDVKSGYRILKLFYGIAAKQAPTSLYPHLNYLDHE